MFLAGLAIMCPALLGPRIAAVSQNPLTPEEQRGKRIFFYGTSSAGREIVAAMGDAGLEVPGNLMACANCHGNNGLGKVQGATKSSNLTWESLTKPNSETSSPKRIHPPYNDQLLTAAITEGIDPAGHRLRSAMPRFQMSAEDLTDLVSYLKKLGSDRDPGVSDDKLVIGTILPTGSLAAMGQSVKAVLTAYVSEVNSQGGIYNRTIELKFVEAGETPAATRAAVERFIKEEHVFALTGAFIAGYEKEILALVDQQGLPLIGPLTLYPQTEEPLNRQTFYLLSGVSEQARALIDFAAKQYGPKNPQVAVVYSRNQLNLETLAVIVEQSKKDGLSALQTFEYPSHHFDAVELTRRAKQTNADAVFLLGSESGEIVAFMNEAEKLSWYPSIYISSAQSSGIFAAPAGFDRRVFLSFATSPADQTASGLQEFHSLAEKHKLPNTNVAAQISTYIAAKLMVEGLRLSSKDPSRESLIRSLESLRDFQTGLTPPITFGADRRIGALGAYVITVDLKEKKFVSVSDWISPR